MGKEDGYDRGYRPSIIKGLDIKERTLLERWGMPPLGTPFASRPGKKAAVWHGTSEHCLELPSLVIVTNEDAPKTQDLPPYSEWFFGTVPVADLPENEAEHVLAFVDAAEFLAPDRSFALEGLKRLVQLRRRADHAVGAVMRA